MDKIASITQQLLQFSPDALIVVDVQGAILFANATAQALFGYSREQMLGQPIDMLVPERFRFRHGAHVTGYLHDLADELGPLWPQTAVMVVTEFGRTAAMNGTRGTDHGTGGCAFLAGGAVRGGRVVADWPGLARTALLDNRDLRPTLDLRSVFKAVLDEHMHVDAQALATRIFPDSSGARPLKGLIRA